jgi:predicted nucleic acid-binding protein
VSRVLVDTSALLALLVPSDAAHTRAKRAFSRLRTREAVLLITSYALLETYSLIERRLGLDAVRAFRERFVPLLEVIWVDASLHEAGLDLMLQRKQRGLSLTDAVSILVAGDSKVDEVFAFDRHLEAAGLPIAR